MLDRISNNMGVRAWTREDHPGKAKEAEGHQKDKFQNLFQKNVETAGQVAQAQPVQAAPINAPGTGGNLDLVA